MAVERNKKARVEAKKQRPTDEGGSRERETGVLR